MFSSSLGREELPISFWGRLGEQGQSETGPSQLREMRKMLWGHMSMLKRHENAYNFLSLSLLWGNWEIWWSTPTLLQFIFTLSSSRELGEGLREEKGEIATVGFEVNRPASCLLFLRYTSGLHAHASFQEFICWPQHWLIQNVFKPQKEKWSIRGLPLRLRVDLHMVLIRGGESVVSQMMPHSETLKRLNTENFYGGDAGRGGESDHFCL